MYEINFGIYLQPVLVNDQLDQLYIEMELEGLSTKLTLEEGITSSSSSGEEGGSNDKVLNIVRNYSLKILNCNTTCFLA